MDQPTASEQGSQMRGDFLARASCSKWVPSPLPLAVGTEGIRHHEHRKMTGSVFDKVMITSRFLL